MDREINDRLYLKSGSYVSFRSPSVFAPFEYLFPWWFLSANDKPTKDMNRKLNNFIFYLIRILCKLPRQINIRYVFEELLIIKLIKALFNM